MCDHHLNLGITTYTCTKDGTRVQFEKFAEDRDDTTFPKVVEAIGGKEIYDRLPVLDLGDKMGGTGYLDFLQPEDLSSPVMKGVDRAGRPFIAFRFTIQFERIVDAKRWGRLQEEAEFDKGMKVEKLLTEPGEGRFKVRITETRVETLFRRYTSGPTWTSGGCGAGGCDLCVGALSDREIERIGRLCRGERIGVMADETAYDEEALAERQERVADCHHVEINDEVIEWSGKTRWYIRAERGDLRLI